MPDTMRTAAINGKMDVMIIDSINRIGRDAKQVLEFLNKLSVSLQGSFTSGILDLVQILAP